MLYNAAMNPPNIGIIVLAAGASTRMGQSKQLLPVNGEPLLIRSIAAALDSTAQKITVVLGANEKEHRTLIDDLNTGVVYNEHWQKGMGSSIKAGLKSLLALNASLTGIVVLVCDQPLLTSDHINRLIAMHVQTLKPIVASAYAGTTGVPVFFHSTCFKQLLSLKDEQGAKKVIQENAGNVVTIDFPQGEIDIDTPDDYNNFQNQTR
jgi:molybdenum cofactor cytidylyltransferase